MWDEIIGHQKNKDFLERLLQTGELPHALLFYGAEGIGKRLLAQEFARGLLCLSSGWSRPCGSCESCRLINFKTGNMAHPDYLFLEPAADSKLPILKVEQLQGLLAQAAYGPTLSEHKICIINEADTMNLEAANAFLKLLEEPPEGWIFILIASSVNKLLPTILSRVIQVRFDPLTLEEAATALVQQGISPEEADTLARLAAGSLGQALAFKEKGVLEIRNAAAAYVVSFPLKAPMGYLLENKYFEAVLPTTAEAEIFANMVEYLFRDVLFMKIGLASQVFNCDIKDKLQAASLKWQAGALKKAVGRAGRAGAAMARKTNAKGVLDNLTLALNDIMEGRA